MHGGVNMALNNNAELGFDKEIWKAADIMRGNMDAAEYAEP